MILSDTEKKAVKTTWKITGPHRLLRRFDGVTLGLLYEYLGIMWDVNLPCLSTQSWYLSVVFRIGDLLLPGDNRSEERKVEMHSECYIAWHCTS